MAQTKRKRKRKHRGTQAGTVEARGRTGKGASGARPAKAAPRDRRAERFARPPTWRSSLNRAAIAAALFAVAVIVLFGQPVGSALVLAAVMVLLYLPMTYYTDRFFYHRHQRRLQGGGGPGRTPRGR